MRRTLVEAIGWGLLVLGALSLVVPLQAVLLVLIGLYILSFEQPWVRAQRQRLERRWPETADQLGELERKAGALFFRTRGPGRGPDDDNRE